MTNARHSKTTSPSGQFQEGESPKIRFSTKFGLMMASSLAPIVFAPAANASCAAVDANLQPVALNAVTSDSVITCSGATTNETITVPAPTSGVSLTVAPGATMSDSFVSLNGNDHSIFTGLGSTLDDVSFFISGDNGIIVLQGTGTNISTFVSGEGGRIIFLDGSYSTGLVAASGNSLIEVSSGASVSAAGASSGFGLLFGDAGNNVYTINGDLTSRADGLFITDVAGDDFYTIGSDASFTVAGGGQGYIVDSGASTNDVLSIFGTHNLNLDITGIDQLIYTATNVGDTLAFNGVANLNRLSVNSGTVTQIDLAAMMDANGEVQIAAGASVRYGVNFPNQNFTQSLTGEGEFILDSSTSTFIAGDNSGFSGTMVLLGDNRMESNQNAAGSAAIVNNGNLLVRSVNLSNTIGGTGNFYMVGAGGISRSTLSGANTYTGNTYVQNAGSILRLENEQSAGSGDVLIDTDALLELDFGGLGGEFTNFISGAGGLLKTGSGILTVSGQNDFTGGTLIEGGILRVTDLGALGTGGIVANAGGALMYDYDLAAPELITSPLMTGAGMFIKEGSGTLVIDVANTWTGGTQIRNGRVGLNVGNGLGSGTIDVLQGAVLGIGGITLANDVTGAGQIIKTASNTAVLTGINTITGGIIIEEGAIEVADGRSLGLGFVDVQSGTSLLIDNAAATTVSAALTGAGTVTKSGAGRVELTAPGQLSGQVSILDGILAVAGTTYIGSAAIDIGSAGTLELATSGTSTDLINFISGDGRVIKTGAARLTLIGSNTYTGGTDVLEGTLRILNTSSLGSGAVTVASGGVLDLFLQNDGTFNLALSGAGILRKSGSGNLLLQANGLTGGLDIEQGTVILEDVTHAGTGPVTTASGSFIAFDIATDQTSALSISGAGGLIKDGSAVLTLTGTNTYSGGTSVSGGRLRTSNLASIGSGVLGVSSGSIFEFTNASDVTFANGLTGSGVFEKLGAGTLSFLDPFSIGTLAVNQGRVRLNGQMTGDAQIASGASLDGIGRITGSVTNAGTIAPGNSIGTLTIDGNYVHDSNAILEIEFDAAGNIDLLDIGGTAQLNGGILRFVSLGGAEGAGGTFLSAAGGITGTFGTIETVGSQIPVTVIYSANEGVVAPSVLSARPSTFNSQALAAADSTLAFSSGLISNALRGDGGSAAWIEAFGASGARDAHGATLAYDHETSGGAIGGQFALSDSFMIGGAVGMANSDVTISQTAGSGAQDTALASVYGRYDMGEFTLTGGAIFGQIDQDTVRDVTFNNTPGSVSGTTESSVAGVFAGGAANLATIGAWSLGGHVQTEYVSQSQEGYTEAGTNPLRLAVPDLTFETLAAEAGLSVHRGLEFGGRQGTFRLDAGVRSVGALDDRAMPVTFAASGAAVELQGDERDLVSPIAGAGFELPVSDSATLSFAYSGRFGDDERQTGQVRLQFRF